MHWIHPEIKWQLNLWALQFDLHCRNQTGVIISNTAELWAWSRAPTLHKASLHLSPNGCWVEYHWFLFFPHWTYVLTLNVRDVHHPFLQYLLAVVPSHHSHRLPVCVKMHLQQLKGRPNDWKRHLWKWGQDEKSWGSAWRSQSWIGRRLCHGLLVSFLSRRHSVTRIHGYSTHAETVHSAAY